MNEFHEINILTSRGDINGALSLISQWSESIARKIMKKAGYSVTPHAGRAFWTWVQATLTDSARQRRCGYRVRAERRAPVRYSRQQAQENYEAYAQMMVSDVAPQAEPAPSREGVSIDTGSEKSVTVWSTTERLAHLCQHGEPALARAAEKRRYHLMSVHSVIPGMFLMNGIFDLKSAGHPYRMPFQDKIQRHVLCGLLTAHPLHVRTRRNRDPSPLTSADRDLLCSEPFGQEGMQLLVLSAGCFTAPARSLQ